MEASLGVGVEVEVEVIVEGPASGSTRESSRREALREEDDAEEEEEGCCWRHAIERAKTPPPPPRSSRGMIIFCEVGRNRAQIGRERKTSAASQVNFTPTAEVSEGEDTQQFSISRLGWTTA